MKPIDFAGSNKTLTKPEGWTDEECSSLPIYTDGKACYSVWKMNWRERLRALISGKMSLWVHSGPTQPPVALQIHE